MSSRRISVSQGSTLDNGQPLPGDAREPEGPADTSFVALADPEPDTSTSPAASPDPFDPASLRLTSDFSASIGVKKALLSVPVRKPDKSWFVRVHPAEEYRLSTAVIELKEDRETYLVAPSLWRELATETTFSPRALFTTLNKQNVLFLWPIRLPGPDGRVDDWSRTALEAAQMAVKSWCRVTEFCATWHLHGKPLYCTLRTIETVYLKGAFHDPF
jgi:hypothetical protein